MWEVDLYIIIDKKKDSIMHGVLWHNTLPFPWDK